MGFVWALGLEEPVVRELMRRHASEIGAVSGPQAASKIKERFLNWSVLPGVDGSGMAASYTYGLMAPRAPNLCGRRRGVGL